MRKPILLGVIAANSAISVFATLAYLAFTSRMAVITGSGEGSVIYTQNGGPDAGVARYVFLSVIIIILQGVMAIFNLSVVPYAVADDVKINPICIALGLVNATLMAGLTMILLAFNLVPAVK